VDAVFRGSTAAGAVCGRAPFAAPHPGAVVPIPRDARRLSLVAGDPVVRGVAVALPLPAVRQGAGFHRHGARGSGGIADG
jgi:hypothetical protein